MDKDFLDFINEVEIKRTEIKCSSSGAFFRGHENSSYQLTPSLLRKNISTNIEHNLYHECFVRANHLVNRNANSWERLAFMQHYGIPTRLLDWTESLAVALFFAVNDNSSNPHLWIINAFHLNKDSTKNSRIFVTGLDFIPEYYDSFVSIENRHVWKYEKPIFLQIPWTMDRLKVQSGFFTFHSNEKPLEITSQKYIRKVDIPINIIDNIFKFLSHAGITEYSVFPDFFGLARFIYRRYNL